MENKVMSYLLVEDDHAERTKFKTYTDGQHDLLCVGFADSVAEALNHTLGLHPQAVILDLELVDGYGFEYLNRLNAMNLADRPAVMVLTNVTGKATHDAVLALDVERVICKSDANYVNRGPAVLFDYLRILQPYFCVRPDMPPLLPPSREPESEQRKRERIQTLIGRYGGMPGSRYASYTIEAILLVTKYPVGHINLKRMLTSSGLCQQFGVTYRTMLAGIQYCVAKMWDCKGDHGLRSDYQYRVKSENGMGETKQVLIYMASQFRD